MNIIIRFFLLVFGMCLSPNFVFSWTTPITISSTTGINFGVYTKANNLGEAVVVWTNGTYPNLSIQASIYDGSNWSSFTTISDSGTHLGPIADIDSSGNIVVLWETIDGSDHIIKAVTKANNNNWSSPQILSTSSNNSYLSIASNSNGETVAGWIDLENDTVQIATLSFGNFWSPINTISSSGGNKANLRIGIDLAGNGFAIWEECNSGNIFASQTSGGFESTWSSPTIISAIGSNSNPSLAVDPSGTAVVAWSESIRADVIVSVYSGNSWSSPTIISNHFSSYPKVGISGNNNFVTWVNLATGCIQASRYVSNTWSSPVNVSNDTSNSTFNHSAANGNSFTIWTDSTSTAIKVVEFATIGNPSLFTVISNDDLSLNSSISTTSAMTVVAWEAISETDHIIRVNIN